MTPGPDDAGDGPDGDFREESNADGGDVDVTSWGAWIAVGIAIGVALGAALDNVGAGIAIGVALGAGLAVSQSGSD